MQTRQARKIKEDVTTIDRKLRRTKRNGSTSTKALSQPGNGPWVNPYNMAARLRSHSRTGSREPVGKNDARFIGLGSRVKQGLRPCPTRLRCGHDPRKLPQAINQYIQELVFLVNSSSPGRNETTTSVQIASPGNQF
jgi:hypothetical protein